MQRTLTIFGACVVLTVSVLAIASTALAYRTALTRTSPAAAPAWVRAATSPPAGAQASAPTSAPVSVAVATVPSDAATTTGSRLASTVPGWQVSSVASAGAVAPVERRSDTRWLGFYLPGVPASMSRLVTLQALVGRRASVVNFFISDSESFPAPRCANASKAGAIPLVTLEFWSTSGSGVDRITSGAEDTYLNRFALAARRYGKPVWLRPFHEMNGNWYPWSGSASGNSAAKVVAAWRHVRKIFAARGATNVKFVWCVNADSVPGSSANAIPRYFPGNAYVDFIAVDGYNFGTSQSWSGWRPFSSIFGSAYRSVTRLSAKPLFIAETASSEQGGNKAAWITDMFHAVSTKYPRIQGIVWFSTVKETDWRVNSSAVSLKAYRVCAPAF